MTFHQSRIWLYVALVAVLAIGCSQQGNSLVIDENAPAQTMKNATIQHTDSGRLQSIIWGEEIWNFDDEDQTQEFPGQVKATFFDDDGNITSVITADEGTNWQRKNLMNLRGNVVIQDIKDGKITYTENFYWDQDKGEIYSDVPVKQVHKDGTIQRGTSFRANEDMSDFIIYNARFEFNL
jgi:LPS export ABC transporter protein LptC